MPETTSTTAPVNHYAHRPSPYDRAHRIVRNTWRALPNLARRAVSAPLRLSWHLEVTVVIDAEVFAEDHTTAATLIEQYLHHPDTRLVAYCPSHGPTGWRHIASTTLTQLRDVTVEHDDHYDANDPWPVTVVATARITLPARDVDADVYFDIEPDPQAQDPIQRVLTSHRELTRTPVHSRRHHR